MGIPVPARFVLSMLVLLLVEETDALDEVESLLAIPVLWEVAPGGLGPVFVAARVDPAPSLEPVLVAVLPCPALVAAVDAVVPLGPPRADVVIVLELEPGGAWRVIEPALGRVADVFDIPVPDRFDVDVVADVRERVGVERFLSSSLLVLPVDLWKCLCQIFMILS